MRFCVRGKLSSICALNRTYVYDMVLSVWNRAQMCLEDIPRMPTEMLRASLEDS